MKGKINPDNDGYDPSEEYFKKKGSHMKMKLKNISLKKLLNHPIINGNQERADDN